MTLREQIGTVVKKEHNQHGSYEITQDLTTWKRNIQEGIDEEALLEMLQEHSDSLDIIKF